MTTKNTQAEFTLTNFNFDSKEVEMIHRQFSGERSQRITMIDDLLRAWAMSSASNPKINVDYYFKSEIQDGRAVRRQQYYKADHTAVSLMLSEPMDRMGGARIVTAKQLLAVYDLAYAEGRKTMDPIYVASYFTLREALARIAELATYADVSGTQLFITFKDGEDVYFVNINLKMLPPLLPFVEQVNSAA